MGGGKEKIRQKEKITLEEKEDENTRRKRLDLKNCYLLFLD